MRNTTTVVRMASIVETANSVLEKWGDISQKKYQKDIWEFDGPRKDVEGRVERKENENVRRLEKRSVSWSN